MSEIIDAIDATQACSITATSASLSDAPGTLVAAVEDGVGATVSTASCRAGGMRIGRAADETVALDLRTLDPDEQEACAAAFVEGIELGRHQWPGRREHVAARGPDSVVLHVGEALRASILDRCHVAQTRAQGANLARALVDTPPSQLTPADFAEIANRLAERHGWHNDSLDAAGIEREALGGLLSVSRGSTRPPFLVDLTYRPMPDRPVDIVLIGKGVTMDCGGLNVKTRGAVTAYMKYDMSGGATVLGTLVAATQLRLDLNVRIIVPLTENLPGPGATLPGDVIRHRGGRTTEVVNTDAEGRLLLADALAYVVETSSDADLITVATLCGGFGPDIVPVVSYDVDLVDEIAAAGRATDMNTSHVMPTSEYGTLIQSRVADAKNYSWDHGAIDLTVVAAFLRPFAADRAWAHLDISDITYLHSAWGAWEPGPTGIPAPTLVELLSRRAVRAA